MTDESILLTPPVPGDIFAAGAMRGRRHTTQCRRHPRIAEAGAGGDEMQYNVVYVMMQRLIPLLVGVGTIALFVLTFIHRSEAYSVVLFLLGLLLLLRNLFPVTRPNQNSPISSRLQLGISLLLIYYAISVYLDIKRALPEALLDLMALVAVVGIWVALRYLWRASRAKRGGGPR
jgi:hypothetical protein